MATVPDKSGNNPNVDPPMKSNKKLLKEIAANTAP